MALVRADAERFEGLPGYDYDVNHVDVGGPEMAYVDVEGDGDETVLCLHGEPTWSYLYRKMIPVLEERGRVIAPDFPGFGRSDKYADEDAYGFHQSYDALAGFVEALDLEGITLVCQDWGGILGLPYATANPGRFDRLVPMNTGVPDGTQEMPQAWIDFKEFAASTHDLPIGMLVANATISDLPDEVLAGYEAPFPGPEYKAAARRWPAMVPTDPAMEGASELADAQDRLADWEKPAFVLFSDSDPITSPNRDPMRDLIPTASEQPDVWIEDAGHFLQEDAGREVAEEVVAFVDRTS